MKKQPKPKPCELLMLADNKTGEMLPGHWSKCLDDAEFGDGMDAFVIRVRIVPVAPKKRAKAKRGGK